MIASMSGAVLWTAACHTDQDPFEDLIELSSTSKGDEGGDNKTSPGDKKPSNKPDPDATGKGSDSAGGGGGGTKGGEPGTTGGGDGSGDGGSGGGKKDCATLPVRYVVMGDAVPSGKVGVDGPDDEANGFKMLHTYIKETFPVKELSYENFAKGGAVTKTVPEEQLDKVPTDKAGHVLVNIHVGGNDLAEFIFKSDAAAEDAFGDKINEVDTNWNAVFDHFNDKSKFPDGATIIVNTQYNPFDDCTETHNLVTLTDKKIELMGKFNDRLRKVATDQPNGIYADQHKKFLGHGHHHDKSSCPHYSAGSEYWMIGGLADMTNINKKGHAGMAEVFKEVADKLYKGCE